MAQVCKACHSLTEGAGPKVGPNLWGVIGKSVADAKDFADYSDAIKAFGGQWTVDRLDQFLSDPTGVVKGTIMVYPGIKNAERRADLIAYLNSNGPSPLVFAAPASAKQTDGAGSPAKPDSTKQFGMLFAAPGAETTYYACIGCHSERIVAQQGQTREDWDELLVWMVEEQGMEKLSEADRAVVLDYLSKHYNTDRPHFPK